MRPGLASNGCSQPKRPAPKWAMPIHAPDKLRSHSKSQNHCAALLGQFELQFLGAMDRRPSHAPLTNLDQLYDAISSGHGSVPAASEHVSRWARPEEPFCRCTVTIVITDNVGL